MPLDLNNKFWKAYVEAHEAWLSGFDPRYLAAWRRLLNNDDEAALCESGVRDRLQEHGVTVEPNEKLDGDKTGGPDFRCTVNGRHFYVEVTCVSRATASERMGLTGDEEPHKLTPYKGFGMVEAVFDECVNKAKQCAGQDAPTLVAVGTFHFDGSTLGLRKTALNCVFTGTAKIAWDIPLVDGVEPGEAYQITELENAAFIKPDKREEVGFARASISGVLLCGFGSLPGTFLGVLHPNPARPFDCSLLPNVDFGSVAINRETRKLSVTWLQNEADEDDDEQALEDLADELLTLTWPGDDE